MDIRKVAALVVASLVLGVVLGSIIPAGADTPKIPVLPAAACNGSCPNETGVAAGAAATDCGDCAVGAPTAAGSSTGAAATCPTGDCGAAGAGAAAGAPAGAAACPTGDCGAAASGDCADCATQ